MTKLHRAFGVIASLAVALSGSAHANTITQNTSWKITRAGSTATYQVVAYGDSIYAGYNGNLFSVLRRAGPWVDGEYLGKQWNADIQVVRRAKSGAKADDIYNNKIIAERSYMQVVSTRVVTFEMCGNDYLQARSNLAGQSGSCNFGVLDSALSACSTYNERAMQAINQYAVTATVKVVGNLYYPGYDADNVLTSCTDPVTGQPVNKQQKFIPYLAHSNWRTCHLAEQYGFKCADNFAAYMGADYDSNGDGAVDSDALKYVSGESEDSYVARITSTLRGTIRDANFHLGNPSTSYDYIQSDNTHPNTYGSATIGLNIFTGSGSGSGAADFSDAQVLGGKNPVWNQYGHERMGQTTSQYNTNP
ncbi:MAG TPA: SGNH/GDSL hydrolase family protein [Myxococcaceae bacterium]|nr:SGNH/GDSL hydrolase family protein [Myxococcaceae bacterium]